MIEICQKLEMKISQSQTNLLPIGPKLLDVTMSELRNNV